MATIANIKTGETKHWGNHDPIPKHWTYLSITDPELPEDTPPKDPPSMVRKQRPIGTGVLDYFPNALLEVAYVSWVGNEQHNPGQPLHWDRAKSQDEADALLRHFLARGTMDTDGTRHSAKLAWRALALLQKELEDDGATSMD